MLDLQAKPTGKQPKNQTVVRLVSSYWHDRRGVHFKRSLNFLRRRSSGFNLLQEDSGMMGAEEVVPRIINLDKCQDGIYYVVTCNMSTDWETGYVDDYDYKLIPYEEDEKCN